jgi:uncharacterized protein (TIGR03435 family)
VSSIKIQTAFTALRPTCIGIIRWRIMGISRRLAIAAILIAASPALPGQSNASQSLPAMHDENAAAKLPAYDVVSIKLNKSGNGSWETHTNNDSYTAMNVSLKDLLEEAYNIRQNLISGVPGPIDGARFDIQAKMVDPDLHALRKFTGKQRLAMLLPFLEERFQLKAHTEIKILSVYELVVTASGPKFKQSADSKQGGTSVQNNRLLTAHAIPMVSLAGTLTGQVHRTVVDKTGLTGLYDLGLKWSPDDGSNFQADSGPSIFTALQEQLGLKLKSAKDPVETLVVDHVEMPSAN